MRALPVLICLLLLTCIKPEPCDPPFRCPEPGYINCMPPVSDPLCSGECHEWVVANCPDVEFAY